MICLLWGRPAITSSSRLRWALTSSGDSPPVHLSPAGRRAYTATPVPPSG
jgi:hypothetical protein